MRAKDHDGTWMYGDVEHVREFDHDYWAEFFKCEACGAPACNRLINLAKGEHVPPGRLCRWSCDAHVEQVMILMAISPDEATADITSDSFEEFVGGLE